MQLTAKLGIAPIAWSNDDLPQLGGDTLLETSLFESRRAGFSGVETGGKFPNITAELAPLPNEHPLGLVSGGCSETRLDADLRSAKAKALPQLTMFRGLAVACPVHGETAGTIHSRQDVPPANRPVIDDGAVRGQVRKPTAFAECCSEQDAPPAVHHHMGTAVESRPDVDRLMESTGNAVHWLFDTDHLTFAGADPLAVPEKQVQRIVDVHVMDVRRSVLDPLSCNSDALLDAVFKGVSAVPGDGCIDFATIVHRIASIDFEERFVVEAEQKPVKARPVEYARIGHRALGANLKQAGYRVQNGPHAGAGSAATYLASGV